MNPRKLKELAGHLFARSSFASQQKDKENLESHVAPIVVDPLKTDLTTPIAVELRRLMTIASLRPEKVKGSSFDMQGRFSNEKLLASQKRHHDIETQFPFPEGTYNALTDGKFDCLSADPVTTLGLSSEAMVYAKDLKSRIDARGGYGPTLDEECDIAKKFPELCSVLQTRNREGLLQSLRSDYSYAIAPPGSDMDSPVASSTERMGKLFTSYNKTFEPKLTFADLSPHNETSEDVVFNLLDAVYKEGKEGYEYQSGQAFEGLDREERVEVAGRAGMDVVLNGTKNQLMAIGSIMQRAVDLAEESNYAYRSEAAGFFTPMVKEPAKFLLQKFGEGDIPSADTVKAAELRLKETMEGPTKPRRSPGGASFQVPAA